MKKIIRPIASAAVSIMLLVIFAVTCFAQGDLGNFRRVEVEGNTLPAISSINNGADGAVNLPSNYSLVAQNRVTSVKDQGVYGTCWAFAALAATESSLITEFGTALDLSELHMSYFSYQQGSDPLGLIKNDYQYVAGLLPNILDEGGNIMTSTMTLAKWNGPVRESVLPYTKASRLMSASSTLQYKNEVAHLENAMWYSFTDMDAIKQALMNYGAAHFSYYSADGVYLNESTGAYHCNLSLPETREGNHAATIVGWNDNYSLTNFGGADGKRTLPKNNGAWLVKNSYSADYGNNGYIWISYEDCSLADSIAVFYDYAPTNNYDLNYQYDGGYGITYYEIGTSGMMANVFEAKYNEVLKAVSFYTLNPNASYTVQIYKNVNGNPSSGVLQSQSTVSGTMQSAGYHTVKLPSYVTLNKGDKYSVVVTLRRIGGKVQMFADGTMYLGGKSYNKTESKRGQSFLKEPGGDWLDVYSSSTKENLRIKAFTDKEVVTPTAVTLNTGAINGKIGEKYTLAATLAPSNSTGNVLWSSSNTAVAKVGLNGEVSIVGAGYCEITAQAAYGNAKAVCTVTVKPQKVTNLCVEKLRHDGVNLRWDKQAGDCRYRIYLYNKDSGEYEYVRGFSGNTYKPRDLVPGVSYKYKVRAYFKVGAKTVFGEYSDVLNVRTKVAMGSTLVASKVSKTTVTLEWEKVEKCTNYRIYMRTADGEYTRIKTVKADEFKVTGLDRNTTYFFKVRALVKVGGIMYEGKASNYIKIKTK